MLFAIADGGSALAQAPPMLHRWPRSRRQPAAPSPATSTGARRCRRRLLRLAASAADSPPPPSAPDEAENVGGGAPELALGFDLGTSNSAVAHVVGRRACVLLGPDGGRTTPSVVAFPPGAPPLLGAAAALAAPSLPGNAFSSVKRLIGRRFDVRPLRCARRAALSRAQDPTVAEELSRLPFAASEAASGGVSLLCPSLGRGFAPEAVSALLLRHLAGFAGGAAPAAAVLAVPARFSEAQRSATRAAASAAGLRLLRLVSEPAAAAIAYGFGCPAGGAGGAEGARPAEEEELVLVFDLGGGTLDCALLDAGAAVFHLLAAAGDARLGGNDFDGALLAWLRQQGWEGPGALEAARALKHALSDAPHASVQLPGGGRAQLSRGQLEELCAPLLERCALPLRAVLAEAAEARGAPLAPADLAAVLLVGGATRMPAVRRLVEREAGKAPLLGCDPDEVVALGCAIQAAALTGGLARGDAILLDEEADVGDFQALLDKMQATLEAAGRSGA